MAVNVSAVCDKIKDGIGAIESGGAGGCFYDPLTDNAVVYGHDSYQGITLAGIIPRTEIRDNSDIVDYAKRCFHLFGDCFDKKSWPGDICMNDADTELILSGRAPNRLALIKV